jgi:high-affinity Fe2+/Pb2+ permease
MLVPHEISLGWVYLPPLVLAVLFGIVAAWVFTRWLNRTGLSRYFWRPQIAFLGFIATFASLFALLVLAP